MSENNIIVDFPDNVNVKITDPISVNNEEGLCLKIALQLYTYTDFEKVKDFKKHAGLCLARANKFVEAYKAFKDKKQLENLDISGDSENPDISGDSETPDISGDSETPDISGDSENSDMSGDSETPDISGDSENSDISVDSDYSFSYGSFSDYSFSDDSFLDYSFSDDSFLDYSFSDDSFFILN